MFTLSLTDSLCRYQFLEGEGGTCEGIGVALGHFLCPLSRDLNHKVCPKL